MSDKRMEAERAAIRRVFASRDGGLLMDYLERTYYDGSLKTQSYPLERLVGRRDVVWQLRQIVKGGETDE